jgi:hypothetical protein
MTEETKNKVDALLMTDEEFKKAEAALCKPKPRRVYVPSIKKSALDMTEAEFKAEEWNFRRSNYD